MKIEIWADLVCPFCYIGKRQLELAIQEVDFKEHVLIEYKSFEILSRPSQGKTNRLTDLLIDRYNLSESCINDVIKRAKEIDLFYRLDMLIHANTFDAHRFLKYACTQDKASEAFERLLKGYFINKESFDQLETYMNVCDDLSFNKQEVRSLLASNKFSRAVKYDQLEAEEIGIKHLPYFLFNEQFALSGVQSVEIFKEALEITWQYMGKKPFFSINRKKRSKTTYCIGKNCNQSNDK